MDQNQKRLIYKLGLYLFHITVWEHENIQLQVMELLLEAIAQERAGLLTDDCTLLKSNLGMLQELGAVDNSNIYECDFEGLC